MFSLLLPFYIKIPVCICSQNKFQSHKTCHRDRIARLTAPCPSHRKINVKLIANAAAAAAANADANADAGGSTIALPGLRLGELKMVKQCCHQHFFLIIIS